MQDSLANLNKQKGIDMSIEPDYFTNLYHNNLQCIWDSLLPAPDVCVIKKDGTTEHLDRRIQDVVKHYLFNIAQFTISILTLPFTALFSCVSSLFGRVTVKPKPIHQVESHTPEAFGYANSGFQDGGIGTSFDPSSLKGQGVGDWNEILERAVQRVNENGGKIGDITHGITLKEGQKIEDLFVNIMDHPKTFAKLLKELGCTAYRISLERSVLEPTQGEFNPKAIQKYQKLFEAMQAEDVEPWPTAHHFTNPDWFIKQGDFANEANIENFVKYCEKMVEVFPTVKNWMTFNEPGIRGLEAYVRGEHPPQQKHIPTAALIVRNILVAHTQAYAAMKKKNPNLNVGITHQWLKFKPLGNNPIEKLVAYFFTSLAHTPIYNFFKNGEMAIKIPFRANVQLRYEDNTTQKVADFVGVQAYGFARVGIFGTKAVVHPGAEGKVNNIVFPRLGIGFTAGSTCKEGGSMQYFGPADTPEDLVEVLEEAFSIPKERVSAIGITETGSDAYRMNFGEKTFKVDNQAQADSMGKIHEITQKYPLTCLFFWTLNRHCEWLSGGMPHLGVTKLKNEGQKITYEKTPGVLKVQEIFKGMQEKLEQKNKAA